MSSSLAATRGATFFPRAVAAKRMFELDPERVRRYAPDDSDLDPIRDEVSAIAGQASSAGSGT